MIFPAAHRALRGLPRPGTRALTRAAMEVALRGVRKILCVAEKNDAAKGIANLLSGGRMRRVRRSPGGRDGDERPLLPPGVPAVGAGRPGACYDRRAFRNGVNVSSLFGDLGSALGGGGGCQAGLRRGTAGRTPLACSGACGVVGLGASDAATRPSPCPGERGGDSVCSGPREAQRRETVKRFGKGVTGGLTSCSGRSQLQKWAPKWFSGHTSAHGWKSPALFSLTSQGPQASASCL